MRLIRVMCTGRVDLAFVIRAFLKGMDGVFIGGCRLNECNYITHGNYHALNMVLLCRKIMGHLGMNPERLRIEFMSSGEGLLFAEVVNDFVKTIKDLGPLGKGEGIDGKGLRLKLETAARLIPYIRLVERERLRIPIKSEEECYKFFGSDQVDRLFNETIAEKLAIGQIVALLREQPLPTGEIARISGLTPSEVSKHLAASSKQGLIRYDQGLKCYALAKSKEQAVA